MSYAITKYLTKGQKVNLIDNSHYVNGKYKYYLTSAVLTKHLKGPVSEMLLYQLVRKKNTANKDVFPVF